MAARPPQNDTSEPNSIEFGIAALADDVDTADIDYPADASEIVRALDDVAVPIDAAGNTVAISDALAAAPKDRFDSRRDLLETLHPVFEEFRAKASKSLMGRLRSLVPF
ncbi:MULTISPECIES: hypothetical protein [Haloferax]|uniref:Uncharacterized protein n=3 Tax=Haloferax TaxID=2251 RepID=M0ILQ6_9EURY|nr:MULTISPECIES: hypothetical protein [Haloferax]ELZ97736.1 hypothetical protein C441_02847 [Haloferax sulfurifontis ATCC BAA-897]MDS0239885.1 hypothetical protein [Haloferax sp. S2CR25]MDS0443006.1 hypothetical protein [Haloferax sp. S2CR25-2]GGC56985.1 hypothetical protein GCM10007209_18490 [Haloferax sulfurifontis]